MIGIPLTERLENDFLQETITGNYQFESRFKARFRELQSSKNADGGKGAVQ